jgi:hypothetical protein
MLKDRKHILFLQAFEQKFITCPMPPGFSSRPAC